MDRDSLAIRNQGLVQKLRQPSKMHRFRNAMLGIMAKAPAPPQSAGSNRLLIIRPDHLGDMLLTTPAIKAIKSQRPELSIHVLCGDSCADMLAHFDEIDRVLTLPFPGFQRGGAAGGNPYLLALRWARKLRRVGYGSAIIMRPDHWWGAMLAYLAGIPQRIGYSEPAVAPFLTVARALRHQHAVEQNWRLAEAFVEMPLPGEIRLDFPLQAAESKRIQGLLRERGIGPGAAIICIHPGSGASSKLWLAEKWAAVADAIAGEFDAAILFTGTAGDRTMIEDIAAKMHSSCHDLAGSTSVGELAALYRRALIALGPDSGAMHVAASVHTPTVALFGPADPTEFAPWGDGRRQAVVRAEIACSPCRVLDWRHDKRDYHPCVRDISVERVLAEARRVLKDGWGRGANSPQRK